MQEFWPTYLERTDRTNDLNDLVFIHWTRVDPEAAIAAAEGTEFAKYPWWAWTCHEPQKALSEVLARYQDQDNKEPIGNVAWGIGEFYPAWLRENLDQLPEKWMRDRALSGYTKWADTEDPLATIEFLKEQGWHINQKTIAALGREDPVEAYRLALELKGDGHNYRYNDLPNQLIDSLIAEDPALVDQLLPEIKSPKAQANLRLRQFNAAIEADPAAAEEKARKLPEGWAREDHLSLLAQYHLKDNPEKALELTALLIKSTSLEGRFTWIHYGNGGSGSGAGNSTLQPLVQHLIPTHARELMEAAVPSGDEDGGDYRPIGGHWADHDLTAFAN